MARKSYRAATFWRLERSYRYGAVFWVRPADTIMNSDQTERRAPPLSYADEVLCASWNPLALLLAEPLARAQQSALDAADVDNLLARLYLCQQP